MEGIGKELFISTTIVPLGFKMVYITLDTCVWLELTKVDFDENNPFEEICYWIENKHLTHIIPYNMIREWNRNKGKKIIEITNSIKTVNKTLFQQFKGNSGLSSIYDPNKVEALVVKRMDRIEYILKELSEIAPEDQSIFELSKDRALNCYAPNHNNDSFRDTVNIFSVINYVKNKGYSKCYFSTSNFNDFSVGKLNKGELHPQLTTIFTEAGIEYVFCDESPFGNRLFHLHLRPQLPNFQDHLQEKEKKEQDRILAEKKVAPHENISTPEKDYLKNIRYIDLIVSNQDPTDYEKKILKMLMDSHTSYKQYALKKFI